VLAHEAVELRASDEARSLMLNYLRCCTCKEVKHELEFYPYQRKERRNFRYCKACEKARDAKRGTFHQRYGSEHGRVREEWRPKVEAGEVDCWRCGERIKPRDKWDLGHDDMDRTKYKGPEHRRCNRATKTHAVDRQQDVGASDWWE